MGIQIREAISKEMKRNIHIVKQMTRGMGLREYGQSQLVICTNGLQLWIPIYNQKRMMLNIKN